MRLNLGRRERGRDGRRGRLGNPRTWLAAIAGILIVALIIWSALTTFFIDVLWYREVGLSSVLWSTLRTRFGLGLVFGLAFFALLYASLVVAWRSDRPVTVITPQTEDLERVRQAISPHLRWALPAIAAAIAVPVGVAASSQWSTYLLWRNGSGLSFGNPEELFGRDPAFYVFSLPWWHYVQSWLGRALVGVGVLSVAVHVLTGGIQPVPAGATSRMSNAARSHLWALVGLYLLVRAWGYHLARFDLLTSPRGVVDGASYTDVKAQLPALQVLTLVALLCAGLFLADIRLRRRTVPLTALGLLALVSVLVGGIYPALVQQFSVKPQEQDRETPYIEQNIEATRRAFGLDEVAVTERPVEASVTAEDLADNEGTVSNIRLWRPSIMRENLQSVQRIRQYYEFADVDVDRYQIDGEQRVLMIAGREVSQAGIPAGGRTWQNTHLVYTHGFGAVAAPANAVAPDGGPDLVLSDIPPEGEPTVDQPRIYYGELSDVPFVVTNTDARELDYEGAAQDVEADYSGTGGIPMGGVVKRALFAWRFQDLNLLISGLINEDSRIMVFRQLDERVSKAAPFLSFDDDPYLAIVDGRLVWIQDAYTSTDRYPYSQAIDLGAATGGLLQGRVNYVRNSVKVTVDAYTGEISYHLVDEDDPIAVAWSRVYPDLFTPVSEASPDLLAHFRYPENLLQVQASVFATYHVTDPAVFFQKQDVWAIPTDPTVAANGSSAPTAMRPFYVQMRLPDGESDEERFQLILPFTPEGRQNLVSWLTADSDPGSYGELTAYVFPSGRNIDGPTQVFAQLNQDPTFSSFRTLMGQEGSGILFGDLLTIPIDDSLIYIVPVYVRSNQESSIPELEQVLVVNGDRVGVGESLDDALADATGGTVPDPGADDDADTDEEAEGDGTGDGTEPDDGVESDGVGDDEIVADLLERAVEHFEAADEALREGDLATYQSEIDDAERLVEQAIGQATATTTPEADTGGTTSTTTPPEQTTTTASADS